MKTWKSYRSDFLLLRKLTEHLKRLEVELNPNHRGKEVANVEEESSFVWDVGESSTNENLSAHLLIGRIWTSKAVNVKATIETMSKLWNTKGTAIGNLLDSKHKIFLFKFSEEKDKIKVIENQPCHFDKSIWCFNEPGDTEKLTDTPLFHVPLWARVYGLPVKGRTNVENIRRLGMQLGQYVMVDEAPFPEMERAIRLRVIHDVRHPLKSGVNIHMPSGRLVSFKVKYEKLPTYCYGCGILGHGEKHCDDGPYELGELSYGEDLRASPWKVVKTTIEAKSKHSKSLIADFEKENKRREEDVVVDMIEKLKNIALRFKNDRRAEIREQEASSASPKSREQNQRENDNLVHTMRKECLGTERPGESGGEYEAVEKECGDIEE